MLDAQFGPPGGGAITPNAFIRIGADDVVTLIIHKPDNGQGTETSIAQLLAEELECDWSRVKTEFAPINAALYGGALQGTFGSMAIRTTYDPMRRTGAAARDMLMQAAAARWGVDEVAVPHGERRRDQHRDQRAPDLRQPRRGSREAAGAGERHAEGSGAVQADRQADSARRHARQGHRARRRSASTCELPEMLYAVVARCPVFGGKVARFDATKAKAVAGVTHVVQIPQGVAVVAGNTWAAMEGGARCRSSGTKVRTRR